MFFEIIIALIIGALFLFIAHALQVQAKEKGRAVGITAAFNTYKREGKKGLEKFEKEEGLPGYWEKHD